MPFTIQQVRETPTGPRMEVFPSCTYGIVNVTNLPGGTGTYITKGINVAIVSTQWNLSPRNILSYAIRPSLAYAGDFCVEISPDGTNFQLYLSHFLTGTIYNCVSGIELPGFAARFSVHNSDPVNAQNFIGSIILKGV